MRRANFSKILGFLALALAPALKADVTGSILGIVTDASSAVLPGVAVTATNLETNLSRSARSDATGQYRILALPVGTCESKNRSTWPHRQWIGEMPAAPPRWLPPDSLTLSFTIE